MHTETNLEIDYIPLTSESRIVDIVIPKEISVGGTTVTLPKSLREKDPHYLLDNEGLPVRAAWISSSLAHFFNSRRLANEDNIIGQRNELARAIAQVDRSIVDLVKNKVLKNRTGPGLMAFCQANENVPKNSILISSRTYETLVKKSSKWKYARTVIVTRFPNLGPSTTLELNLIVNRAEDLSLLLDNLPATAIGNRINNLSTFLDIFKEELQEEEEVFDGIVDALYVHPEILKDCLQGDGRPTCR